MSKRLVPIAAGLFLLGSATSPAIGAYKSKATEEPIEITLGNAYATKASRPFGGVAAAHRHRHLHSISLITRLRNPDLDLRRLDEEIDRKLIICRGC
jgi:hypothetical protein